MTAAYAGRAFGAILCNAMAPLEQGTWAAIRRLS
jgi:hypothetical protein